MAAYYNEIDPYAAQWLRNLIGKNLIASGDVDERSIVDVKPDDLHGYDQCHFFAGIGGWSYALRLAGWPDDRPVWTGSCPCQPFSAAGKGAAANDERHLWPAWFPLIRELRPATVFGEQVEAAVGWGWLDAIFSDLEGEGYACGTTVLPACGIGAPHIRQRLWFVANTNGWDASTEGIQRGWEQRQQPQDGCAGELAYTVHGRTDDASRQSMGTETEVDGKDPANDTGRGNSSERTSRSPSNPLRPWDNLEWIECSDGKARPTQPGIFPLAHGVSARVGKLRAAGNAIVPQVAAIFIEAVLTCRN